MRLAHNVCKDVEGLNKQTNVEKGNLFSVSPTQHRTGLTCRATRRGVLGGIAMAAIAQAMDMTRAAIVLFR